MELTSTEINFLEQNIEEELADYHKYMEQAQQATHPQLARLWQAFAQDERRHAERQRAILTLAGQRVPVPPATIRVPPATMPAPPAAVAPVPGFEWRGAPWPGPVGGGSQWPAVQPRRSCCGG